MQLTLVTVAAFTSLAGAASTGLFPPRTLEGRGGSSATSPVSQDEISSVLERPALHTRLVYCSAGSVTSLTCGGPCEALSDIKILTIGGNDDTIPGYYIATDPTMQAVVIAHKGANPESLISIAGVLDIPLEKLNPELFPSSDKGAEVHDGFQQTQGLTANIVLTTVKSALASTGYTKVLVAGHSLGGAVALLDATMLKMQLPSTIQIITVTFGMPRVGNQKFANMVDRILPGVIRVTNQDDIVPIVPPQILDFRQVSGEIHVKSVNKNTGVASLVSCPGQENPNCAEANSIFDISLDDHFGPYFNGISFGSDACPA